MFLVMSAKVPCKKCSASPNNCKCGKKTKSSELTQVTNALNSLNSELTGLNSNVNNNMNNLTDSISNSGSSLSSNLSQSLSTLNANLNDSIAVNTNTLISNMNTTNRTTCSLQEIGFFDDFFVPCGTSITLIKNFSSLTTLVELRVTSFQPIDSPCQVVLVIVRMDGTIIERPVFQNSGVVIDSYSSISIRCESAVAPPPAGVGCRGIIEYRELFCICCSDNNAT